MMNLKKENLYIKQHTYYSVELLLFILIIIYPDEFYIKLINRVNLYETICCIKYNWTSSERDLE